MGVFAVGIIDATIELTVLSTTQDQFAAAAGASA